VKDGEIDKILKQAAKAPEDVAPVLLDRIATSIESSLGPVRPLPPSWVLEGRLVLICAAVALAGAARSGFYGIQRLSVLERGLIFPALGVLTWLAGTAYVSEMIPGSRRRVSPQLLLVAGSMALLAIFAGLFRDYRTDHFLSRGLVCLTVGLVYAIPTGFASWLLLRRGFAVNSVSAGLVAGTLAGLAGVTMLELHCPNLQAPHVMLWHTAVIPLSAGAGAMLASAAPFLRRRWRSRKST
jgi:hypothetical protein